MKNVERIGVSLEKGLLSKFDKLIAERGYPSRSEAIRDLVRDELGKKQVSNPRRKGLAVVFLVYNHHHTKLLEKLTKLQHSHLLQTISSIHVHLDKEDCLEVIVLRGKIGELNHLGEKLTSLKGVKQGQINLVYPKP